jgi:hypothetical protein
MKLVIRGDTIVVARLDCIFSNALEGFLTVFRARRMGINIVVSSSLTELTKQPFKTIESFAKNFGNPANLPEEVEKQLMLSPYSPEYLNESLQKCMTKPIFLKGINKKSIKFLKKLKRHNFPINYMAYRIEDKFGLIASRDDIINIIGNGGEL